MNSLTVSLDRPLQIPPAWRKKFGKQEFELRLNKRSISLTPKKIERLDCWDAMRDNGGKGISVTEMIALVERSLAKKLVRNGSH